MIDYKKLYFQLFNTLTDALEAQSFEESKAILRKAQIDAEEMYLEENDDE
ncbi:MAG: hypothetical protein IJZ66_09210 [Oscillibacter sp.]|nr:hypothetical protein [Oscillibacter sp.]